MFSMLDSGGMPPPDRFGAECAGGAQDAVECHGPQDPSIEVVRGDGTLVPEMVLEMDTSTVAGAATSVMMSEVAAGSPTTTTSQAVGASQTAAVTTSVAIDDDAPKEPKIVMEHPCLGTLG
jgi:hypothetical protein